VRRDHRLAGQIQVIGVVDLHTPHRHALDRDHPLDPAVRIADEAGRHTVSDDLARSRARDRRSQPGAAAHRAVQVERRTDDRLPAVLDHPLVIAVSNQRGPVGEGELETGPVVHHLGGSNHPGGLTVSVDQ
jgi:hypothetical protein